jgi:hypothetical protein
MDMDYRDSVGSAKDIINNLERICSDPDKLADWLSECRDFEARGWVSIETDRLLNTPAYAV